MFRVALVLAMLLAGCATGPERAPVIGEAYVGPASLPLRDELAARAKTVATLKHGERLDIVGRRRRFFRVRTEKGVEGWLDSRQLLAESDLEKLKELAARMAKSPSYGAASVYDVLNVHIVPNRYSPSFLQIQPGEKVDVVAYHLAPRVPFNPPPLIEPPPKAKAPAKKPKKQPAYPRPPAGKPPSVPENWLELSKTTPPEDPAPPASGVPGKLEPPQPATPPPPTLEDWALIRRVDGARECGWVLTRLLVMAIPDDVAIYAERQRITGYYEMARVVDAEQGARSYWLWTTMSRGGQKHHFDRVRFFTWNLRRHRYETAFQERDLIGYLPVEARPAPAGSTLSSFTLLVLNEEGVPEKREYTFNGYRVALVNRTPAELPPPAFEPRDPDDEEKPSNTNADDEQSLTQRFQKFVKKATKFAK